MPLPLRLAGRIQGAALSARILAGVRRLGSLQVAVSRHLRDMGLAYREGYLVQVPAVAGARLLQLGLR